MLLNRETYVQMLTKLAAVAKDNPHQIDSSAVSQSEHQGNKKEVKSDLHELFDEARRAGKVDTALLKKTLPKGERETSNPLVKVAEAFFTLIPQTLFLKEASPAYHAAMERGFRAELEKIAKVVGQTGTSYAGAQARPIQQVGRPRMDSNQVQQFHEITQGVPQAAGPGPVGQSPGAVAHSQAAAQQNWQKADAARRASVASAPKPAVDTAALAKIHGTGSALREAPAAGGFMSKLKGFTSAVASKLKTPAKAALKLAPA